MNSRGSTKLPSFEIASASAKDCPECAQLLVEQLAEHGVNSQAEPLAKVLSNAVNEPACGFLLTARVDGQIVGVAYVATILSAEHCGIVAWLEELYVAPKHRGGGIGSGLVETVLERARELGAVAIDLEVDEAHRQVATLYQGFGFRPLKRSRWVKRLVE